MCKKIKLFMLIICMVISAFGSISSATTYKYKPVKKYNQRIVKKKFKRVNNFKKYKKIKSKRVNNKRKKRTQLQKKNITYSSKQNKNITYSYETINPEKYYFEKDKKEFVDSNNISNKVKFNEIKNVVFNDVNENMNESYNYEPYTINYKGKTFHLGSFTGNMLSSESVILTQREVDRGEIAIGFNDLDFTDGKMSFLMGHNPGIFSYLAQNYTEGDKITITDKNKITKDCILSTYAIHNYENGQNIDFDIIREDTEKILIQYCISGNRAEFLLATPIN